MTDKYMRRALALATGLFLFSGYMLVYRGGFHSVDEVSMFAVTESLVKLGRLDTNQIAWTQWTTSQAEAQGFFGSGGNVYSKKGLGLSLVQIPLYALALVVPGWGMLQTVALLNAFVTAGTALLIFMFLWRLDFAPLVAVSTAVVYGVGTIAFVYARYLFSEPLAGFMLLLAAYMLFTYRQEGGLRHLAIAGAAAGFAVLTRANNLFLVPVFGLYLLWILWQARPTVQPKQAIAAGATFVSYLAIPGIILLSYNALRAGNPLQTGYDLTLFSSEVGLGLYKLLFSPLRGLFVYSPVLLLSLIGWWLFRRRYPAEAWLFAGLVGVTVGLFATWSSGEGLSWGSRFLVPVVPFFALCLAPIIAAQSRLLQGVFYALLIVSIGIQLLGALINPWAYLSQLQAEFGGEFFLENTPALYDFRLSPIVGQLQMLSASDVAWWQHGSVNPFVGVHLAMVFLAGWLLWLVLSKLHPGGFASRLPTASALYPVMGIVAILTGVLLNHYYHTDSQFGPLDDGYTHALETAASQAGPNDVIVTVAQYHYHVPMNRFKDRVPIIGLAQQPWPIPETTIPLLETTLDGANVWLVTVGFPPASPENATEQWLIRRGYKASDAWFADEVRLVRLGTASPTAEQVIEETFGTGIELATASIAPAAEPWQVLPVELRWHVTASPDTNYNLFLQLLAADGSLAAQHDNPPNGGYTPTSTWRAGESIVVRHGLVLPAEVAPGPYRLIAGLYDPTTGQRLTTESGADFVTLGEVYHP